MEENSRMAGRKRVGYWLSERKSKKLSWDEVLDEFRNVNLDAVKIDLTVSLEQQGPFDAILHKLTDCIAQGDLGHEESRKMVSNLESYAADHPEVFIVDPINCLRTVIDRFKTYSIIHEYLTDDEIFVPSFVVLEENNFENNCLLLSRSKAAFPLVCKPIIAHGSSAAHEVGPKPRKTCNLHVMTLVFNTKGLAECTFPCVVQSFVNHNAVLYKLFALGDKYVMVERPSIKNLTASEDAKSIHFHSGDISKPTSCSRLTVQDPKDECNITRAPAENTLKRVVSKIREVLRLGLFGVDVVVEESTGRIAIIDVNCFPGYDGVDNFPAHLAAFLRTEIDRNEGENNGNGHSSPYPCIDACESRNHAFPTM